MKETLVNLTEEEIELARKISTERQRRNEESTNKNARIDPDKDDIEMMMEGFCGELAFCKIFGTKPDFTTDPRKSRDDDGDTVYNSKNIDVKTTKVFGGSLQAPKWTDSNVDAYALMHGSFKEHNAGFVFKGFMTKKEFIRPERLGTLGHGLTYLADYLELKEFDELEF